MVQQKPIRPEDELLTSPELSSADAPVPDIIRKERCELQPGVRTDKQQQLLYDGDDHQHPVLWG